MLSVNTNGIKRNGRKLIEQVLSQYHIAAVQETKFRNTHHVSKFRFHLSSTSRHRLFLSDRNGSSPVQIGPRSSGIATLLHPELPGVETAQEVTEVTITGRYLLVRLTTVDTVIYIHNVYAPVIQAERAAFFQQLPDQFDPDAQHIILGDLNVAVDPRIDSRGTASTDTSRGILLGWLASLRVIDPWRLRFPNRRMFSGPTPRVNRLDYIFISDEWVNSAFESAKYFQAPHSGDHLAVRVVMGEQQRKPRAGYWRLRSATLEDGTVRVSVLESIRQLAATIRTEANPGRVWEGWKRRIRAQLRLAQERATAQETDLLRERQQQTAQARRQHEADPTVDSAAAVKAAAACEDSLIQSIADANQDRGFDFHALEMERSSSAFFRPPSANLRSTAITSVVNDDGTESCDPTVIASRFKSHWGAVFGDRRFIPDVPATDPTATNSLAETITRRLSPAQTATLDSPITAEDLAASIRHLKKTSAPGLDGLGPPLYLLDPESFGVILATVFTHQLSRGTLLPSQSRSCVSLLYKKGDRRDPGNYRPISLLPVDVKILSKTLAHRLQSYLPSLIHTEQKGFVKGRSLHHQVRMIADLKELLRLQRRKGYALFLDFAKAYDRVDWVYMHKVLEHMGCGAAFRSWIQLLYSNAHAVLSLNGTLQEILTPTRGVKQGDPLSSLLFVLTIEPLGNLIRSRPEYGIPIANGVIGSGLYFADDSTLLSPSLEGLQRQVESVQLYCAGSGALLNLSKSQLFSFSGETMTAAECPLGISTTDTVTYLGLPFSNDPEEASVVATLETKMLKRLAVWGSRARTYRGRLLMLQAMILSTLWHYTLHYNFPDTIVRRWQALCEKYLLTRRGDITSRYVKLAKPYICHVPFKDGGLQMPLIGTNIQVQRINLLQQLTRLPASEPWSAAANGLIAASFPGGLAQTLDELLHCSIAGGGPDIQAKALPPWWKCTWTSWSKIPCLPNQVIPDPVERQAVLLQAHLWHNRHPQLSVDMPRDPPSTMLTRSPSTCRFRSRFAAITNCRSLHDFYAPDWPTTQEFLERFYPCMTEWRPNIRVRHLLKLYADLDRLERSLIGDGGLFLGPLQRWAASPLVGTAQEGKVSRFPTLHRRTIRTLLTPVSARQQDHPINHLGVPSASVSLSTVLQALKSLRAKVLPVYSDLQFRLAWKLLPTRSRFWFLQRLAPEALYCPYPECGTVESDLHLFWECSRAATLWTMISDDWRLIFNAPLRWANICICQEPAWTQSAAELANEVSTLWAITRCAAIHVIWTARNKHQFEHLPPMIAKTAIYQVYSTISAHCRSLLRNADPAERTKWTQSLSLFPNNSRFGNFISKNRKLFTQRRRQRYLDLEGRLQALPQG